MNTITLGSCDVGKKPSDPKDFLKYYHGNEDGKFGTILKDSLQLRDDSRTEWKSFKEKEGNEVIKLQQFLKRAGFMPRATVDGVFGYVTQAATRLFQEYVRTVKGEAGMVPDGRVGPITWKYINEQWGPAEICDWGRGWTATGPSQVSDEYQKWISLLKRAREHYKQQLNASLILSKVESYTRNSDTKKLDDWAFSTQDNPKEEIHLIGITKENQNRHLVDELDDIFILLINGMVFKFWGSTDPRVKGKLDKPFLVEGQHKYRFGWHRLSKDEKGRYLIYRAFKPYKYGVLVVRNDRSDTTMAMDSADIERGLETNYTINIHWSGFGISNWSDGCQVIAGKSYINNRNEVVDCTSFAAGTYGDLNTLGEAKTKGAYNVLTDLILCYAPPNTDHINYTLGRESSLIELDPVFGKDFLSKTLQELQAVD